MNDQPNIPIIKSYPYHGDKCWYVSTIERTYDTCAGSSRGQETIVWECDPKTFERGKLIHQAGGIHEHVIICRCLVAYGRIPDEDHVDYRRFSE